MTTTDIATIRERSKSDVNINQQTKLKIASIKIEIEKYFDSSFVLFSIFGFELRASSSRFTILLTVEFA